MSELRFCPIKRRWSIIAPERTRRPAAFLRPDPRPEAPPDLASCPFEPGNEEAAGPVILELPPPRPVPGGPGWQVRVVANRFPVMRVEGDVVRAGVGLFDRVSGVGAHEVVIESPDHRHELADLEPDEIAVVLRAFRERLLDLRRDARLRYVLVFKNRGREAGATNGHPHSQLIATPAIPTFVVHELRSAREHYRRKERCLFCDVLAQERRLGERLALDAGRFVAVEPYAAALPFETWVLPARHCHDFALASDDDLAALAEILGDLLRRVRVLLEDPPYNLVLHSAPSPHPRPARPDYWSTLEHDFHWHLELVPRITRIAGFEWGSGYTINPTPPEEAARLLAETRPEE